MLGTMYDVDVDDKEEGTSAEVKKNVSLGRLRHIRPLELGHENP